MSSVASELSVGADLAAVTVAGNLKRQEKMMPITASDFVASQHVALDLVVVPPAGERLLFQKLTGCASNYPPHYEKHLDLAAHSLGSAKD